MKKISTLAVALMTLGSLVTPAQADKVPTSTLPSGYYKIKSATTQVATRPNIHLFSDYFLESNTNHATLLSSTTKDNNNYIWKITNDGNATIGIVNGQGTPIKRENGASGSYTYAEHSTLTPLTSESTIPSSILFSEYLFTTTSAGTDPDKNHQYGDYTAVAYYNGHKGENTKWNLEKVDVDANVYTVSIVTTSTGSKPYITRALADGTKEYAFNSGFFISSADLDGTSLAASTLEGYGKPDIMVDNLKKTITAYYAKYDDLTALITSAENLLNTRGVGYPLSTSNACSEFKNAILVASDENCASSVKLCAEAYTSLQNAITKYRSTTTDIQMPEDGKVYRIYAKWADGTKVYAVNDPTKETKSQYRTTGTLTLPSDNSAIWVMQKVGDYYNIVSANADKLFTYMNQETADGRTSSQFITKVSGLRFGQLNIATKAKNNEHIVMAKDGSKMGFFTNQSNETHKDWSTEWCFEEVPTSEFAGQTVNFAASADGHCYATLNLPYASKLPPYDDVTAYKATVEGSTVNLTKYKTVWEVLPANTPVLLTAESAGEKNFVPAPYAAAEETGFKGTLAATAVTDANVYILSMGNGDTAKFFALDETNNTINANKAYLVVPGGKAQALNFNFGNTTGIQNAAVEGVNANAPLFDLSGRRVVKAVKGGIYIQNGKKFVK